MASLIYGVQLYNVVNAYYGSGSFKLMLVTSSYVPNEDTHAFRSDVTNEVTGTGYSSGGNAITPTVTHNTASNNVTVAWSTVTWASSTITAAAGVVYKVIGSAGTDTICQYVDFSGNISSTGGTFTANSGTQTYQR
jgi:hypothetical protein